MAIFRQVNASTVLVLNKEHDLPAGQSTVRQSTGGVVEGIADVEMVAEAEADFETDCKADAVADGELVAEASIEAEAEAGVSE